MKKHTLVAVLAAATALSTPAVAQTTWIGHLKVTVLPAPTCDFGVPFPSQALTFGEPGPATIMLTEGGKIGTDPFAGIKTLAGISPFLALIGSSSQSSAVYWSFVTPQHSMQLLWGTPDQWNHLAVYDQTGNIKLGEINGAELNRRFNGGAEAKQLAILIESKQPFYTALVGSRGNAYEVANVAFDAKDHCSAQ